MGMSVIIPLYNKERHIANTIRTVLNQKYQDFELIIFNDGSTDRSLEIAKGFDDPRVRIVDKKNEGVSRTRNRGVREACNELVAFLDADDEWDESYLQEIVLLSKRYPEAAIYATNYEVIENNGKRYHLDYPEVNFAYGLLHNYFESAYMFTPLWTSAVCIKRSIFLEYGGFPTEIRNGEDLDLWCRIALKHPIAYANIPLAIYRRDSDNMLSRSNADPSWFPFLVEYRPHPDDRIKDEVSIYRYILKRQLDAASAALFVVGNREKCNEILDGVQHKEWSRKKYYALRGFAAIPVWLCNGLYSRICQLRKNRV